MSNQPSGRAHRSHSITTGTPVQTSAAGDLISQFTSIAFTAANTATKLTQKGVNLASGVMFSTADAVGLKDKVEAAENTVRKLAARGRNDANKAVNRARRMATRAIDFNEDDHFMQCYDYDLLLSAPGAVEKRIAPLGNHTPTFTLPANNSLVYKIRVKKWDIGFSIREIPNGDGQPIVMEPLVRYGADSVISGIITAVSSESRIINFLMDNSHSPLQGKNIVYWVAIGENVSLQDDQNGGVRSKEMTAAEEGPLLE